MVVVVVVVVVAVVAVVVVVGGGGGCCWCWQRRLVLNNKNDSKSEGPTTPFFSKTSSENLQPTCDTPHKSLFFQQTFWGYLSYLARPIPTPRCREFLEAKHEEIRSLTGHAVVAIHTTGSTNQACWGLDRVGSCENFDNQTSVTFEMWVCLV